MTNVDDLEDIAPSYPVIVEYTFKHVVWVEAGSPAKAAKYVQEVPYEHTSDQTTLCSAWWEVSEPKDWDWRGAVYDYSDGPYTTLADAHVETHKAEMRRQKLAADRAACTAAGHPETQPPIFDGRIWCKRCVTYLDPNAAEAVSA